MYLLKSIVAVLFRRSMLSPLILLSISDDTLDNSVFNLLVGISEFLSLSLNASLTM